MPPITRAATAAASRPKTSIMVLAAAFLLLSLALSSRANASVYWASFSASAATVGTASNDGTGVNQAFITDPASPCAVASDGAHVYWAALRGSIGRANLDGTGVNPAFIRTVQPITVAVDPGAQAPPASRISIGDVSTAEGNTGQMAFRFTVSLDHAQSAPLTVAYATENGTATAPGDYIAQSGTVTFAPGETAKTVTVAVNGDTTVEPNETFSVNLSNPIGNAAIADSFGLATIVNDDHAATPTVSSVTPKSGPTSGGTAVTISGTGFAAGDRVVIGQGNGAATGAIAATAVRVVSATQITATTGGGAKAGTWNLFVIAPDGTVSQAVSADRFTYTA
jgi:hypothetical protein